MGSSHEFSVPKHGRHLKLFRELSLLQFPLSPSPFVSVSKQLVGCLGSSGDTDTACGRSLDIVPRCLSYLHH